MEPYLIKFPTNGSSSIGYLSIIENSINLPFTLERIFWTFHTPDSIVRGRHAHYNTEMVLIALSGRIIVNTEMPVNLKREIYILENPNEGLYIPKQCWHTMQYSHNSVQLVIASTKYNETDYIRDYSVFQKIK
jgi:mannose-6-phosphate isomerase-like protein (cupin superfamily)